MIEQEDMTIDSIIQGEQLQQILEAALLAAGQPLSMAQLSALFTDEERPPKGEISRALDQLANDCTDRGVELKKVAWPTRKQTLGSTLVVIILVTIIAFFLGAVDIGLSSLVKLILR